EIGFQDYFVGKQHSVPVSAIRFEGTDRAAAAPGVIDAIATAQVVVVAPSNPIVSIGPVLAVDGVREAVVSRRDRSVAVSPLAGGDVVVVTQKIVSKAEAMLEAVDPDDPLSHKAIVERESVRVLRRRGDLIISETKHGFVCANAGVDLSNVEHGYAALLPEDSDRSARR